MDTLITGYIIGFIVLAFYWIADCSTWGPLNRLLNGQYNAFSKHSIVICGLFMWPITLAACLAGFAVLVVIGALIDENNDALARIIIAMLLVGVILAMAGQTGRKISWGE